MKQKLSELLKQAKEELAGVQDKKVLESLRVKYLGKKGPIKDILSQLGQMSGEERKEIGQAANKIKQEIAELIEKANEKVEAAEKELKLAHGVSDLSAPMKKTDAGYFHPITLVQQKMIRIFSAMGYNVVEGPELEEEFYNFEALNIPAHHPARDDHDSFYIDKKVLRTHTSPVQVRTMKKRQPPIAILAPGRCYRRDQVDATHSPIFHQMEGLVVDEGITFADLKGTLLLWAKMMFGEETKIRLRPDFFPFTEPSAELAVTCPVCGGSGCNVCKKTGWIEIAGCGLVDPEVLKNVGYDPDKVSGFAFGMGLERIAMVVYGIKDIREFYLNDMRLLEKFMK